MTKRHLILKVFIALVLAGCQGSPAVSTTVHKCVPPAYPSFQVSALTVRRGVNTTTKHEIEKVRTAYFDFFHLDPVDSPQADRRWTFRQLGDGYLFECSGIPNDYEIEFGCILLTPTAMGTSTQRLWDITEGGVSCLSLFLLM